ncbi:MAG: hypothetical protein ACLU5J_05910 [Christensenellales bacterium]
MQVKKYTPNDMVGLVMNPKTSEILAMASRPTFNLESYQDYPQEIYNRNYLFGNHENQVVRLKLQHLLQD